MGTTSPEYSAGLGNAVQAAIHAITARTRGGDTADGDRAAP
jgi:hypothetical protein